MTNKIFSITLIKLNIFQLLPFPFTESTMALLEFDFSPMVDIQIELWPQLLKLWFENKTLIYRDMIAIEKLLKIGNEYVILYNN
jgi:hypothetical protein